MKNTLLQLGSKINRQHIQFILTLIALALLRSWHWCPDGRRWDKQLMILWLGLGAGLVTGLGLSKWRGNPTALQRLITSGSFF
jgi:hypothetical protein